jgi:hypothetical protein
LLNLLNLLLLLLLLQAVSQECTMSAQTLLPNCGCCAGLYCCEYLSSQVSSWHHVQNLCTSVHHAHTGCLHMASAANIAAQSIKCVQHVKC